MYKEMGTCRKATWAMKVFLLAAFCELLYAYSALSESSQDTFVNIPSSDDACGVNGVCNCFDTFDYLESLLEFYVVCDNRHLTHFPRNVPSNVSSIDFSKNKLGEITSQTFPAFPMLSFLDLSSNTVRRLQPDSFYKLSNLQYLVLAKNQIESLTTRSFHGLGNLTMLVLFGNEISSFPSDTFRPLRNLTNMDLSFNSIVTLPKRAFFGLNNLKQLSMYNNFITELATGSFGELPSLRDLNLIENKIREIHNDVFYNNTPITFLNLSRNSIEKIHPASFRGLGHLTVLDLSRNQLSQLPKDAFIFNPSLAKLMLSFNRLYDLPDGIFFTLNKLKNFIFRQNKLKVFPNLYCNVSRNVFEVDFSGNIIHNLTPSAHLGNINAIQRLYLSRNQISVIPKDIFQNLYLGEILDLADNRIEEIPRGLFRRNKSHGVVLLLLQRNLLKYIPQDSFLGLDHLRILCLFGNKIQVLEDGSLSGKSLQKIYLFQNNLTTISGGPFRGKEISEIHLYGNKIETISEKALLVLKNDSVLFISCEFLKMLPRDSNHQLVTCVSPSSLPVMSMKLYDAFLYGEFERGGFNCNTSDELSLCFPCEKGTFGDRQTIGCQNCPRGGYYQDEVGQTASEPGGMSCKSCNAGTYVKEGGGVSIQQCQVCPEGTNQEIAAGFRACFCKDNYTRTDRYGPCSICLEEGLDCSRDFTLLKPGYFWSWNFSRANLSNYRKFVENLKKEVRNATINARYNEEIPRVFTCQRSKSCPNNNDIIEGQCADGYKGWLCSNCQSEYYSVLNTCVPCPRKEILVLEVGLFLSACVFICYIFSWQIKKDATSQRGPRSLVDVVISRVKILLGFYQVVGEIFSSLHEINWTGPLVLIGTFISSLELNILRIFVRPRCFSDKLIMTPQTEFIIGVSCPIVIIVVPFILYQIRKCHLKCKSLIYRVPYFRGQLNNFKLRLYTCVIVLMFLTYPPICSVIFELYPKACKTFYLDKDGNFSVTRLRSDFDVDCKGLVLYHYCAYFFTGSYVIAFPAILFLLLWKYCSGTSRIRLNVQISSSSESDSDSREEVPLIQNITTHSPAVPVWLNFLRENYKNQFWFWEIVELARKVTQTLLITLFGWEDRLTVLLTTCISVLFLLMHARYRPMKSSYEQRLQMLSLTVIFLNVIIASNDVPSTYDDAVTIILILLNIFILVIIAGEIIITLLRHLKHMNVRQCTYLAITGLRRYLQRRRME